MNNRPLPTWPPSWRAVANELAARLEHHARCGQHREADADPENCPFCADRAAYRLWERKAGVQPIALKGSVTGEGGDLRLPSGGGR